MNIFLRELKANLKSLVIWSVIITVLIIMAVSKFTAFAGDPETIEDAGFHATGDAGRLQHAEL